MTLRHLGFLLIGAVATRAQVLPTDAQPPKGAIEGRVLNLAGEPLKKATLQLRPIQQGPPNPSQTNTTYSATTLADGKFVFHDLPAATYFLEASRVGYVRQSYGAKSPFAQGTGSSQGDGSFVIGGIAPGRYVMSASIRDQYYSGITEDANKNNRESNLSTFYPNAPDATSAAALNVTAGAELRGIEIRIRRGRTYEIRGRIQNTTALPNPQGTSVFLYPKGSDAIMPHNTYVQGKTSEFQFQNLAPGTYLIGARTQAITKDAAGEVAHTTTLIGPVEVTVGDGDVESVMLPLGTGIEVTGSVKTEGNPAAVNSHPRVYLRPKVTNPYIGGGASAETGDDGSFRVRTLAPEIYEAQVNSLPDGSYVKSMQFDGQDITGKDLDLTAGNGGELQILVSPNAGDVTGIVRNENGDPATSATIQIFDETRLKGSSSPDQTGSFHLKNLAPGEYKIFAWEDSSSGITQDPEFRKQFEPQVVKLVEKSHENIELKLITKDAIETAAAKVE